MKAAQRDRYGGPDVVEIREVETPVPGEGEVLVRVRAASVNRADLDWLKPRPGFVRLFLGMRRPRDPRMGWDVAGEVESVGQGVTRWQPGDAVMADLANHGGGTFAEYVSAPADAFERIPEGMSFEESSTLPHSAILALQGLRNRKGRTPKAGDRVLVVGASGNVGPFAVQIAKAMGAHVTGVASRSKVDLVREIGADEVLDYESVNYTRSGRRWDWILECDSHYSILSVRRALNPGGTYITLGGETGLDPGFHDGGAADLAVQRQVDGPRPVVEAVQRARCESAEGADRGRAAAAGDRPDVSAGPGGGRAAPGGRGTVARQGRHHDQLATQSTAASSQA